MEHFSDYAEFEFLGDKLVARPKRQRPPVVGQVPTQTWETTPDRIGRVFNKTTEKIGFNATNLPQRPETLEEGNNPGEASSEQSNADPPAPTAPTVSQPSPSSGKKKRANPGDGNSPSKKVKANPAPKKPKANNATTTKKKNTKASTKKTKTAAAEKPPAPKKSRGKRSADTMISPAAQPLGAVATTNQSNMEPSTSTSLSTLDSRYKRLRTLPSTGTSSSSQNLQPVGGRSNFNVNTDTQNVSDMEASLGLLSLSFGQSLERSQTTVNSASEANLCLRIQKRTAPTTSFIPNSTTEDSLEDGAHTSLKKSKKMLPPTFKNKKQKQNQKQNTNGETSGWSDNINSNLFMDSEMTNVEEDTEMTDVEDDPVEMEWEL